MKPELSIIIPCYNEEKNIDEIYKEVIDINLVDMNIEIIFVNNGSKDNTEIEINVIHEPYGEINFGVRIKITINCKSKKEENAIFHLELDYYGLFKSENTKLVDKNKLASEGARIIFPFARSVIASITQNGGFMPIILDNVNFNLMKS